MSKKAEEYITLHKKLARNYSPRLSIFHARKAVEIAREEAIEEISHWIEEHCYDYLEFGEAGFGANFDYPKMINDLKKAMEEKV